MYTKSTHLKLQKFQNAILEGEFKTVLEIGRELTSLSESPLDFHDRGMIFGGIGKSYVHLGHIEEALENYDRAIYHLQYSGDYINLGLFLCAKGEIHRRQHQYEKSIECFDEALNHDKGESKQIIAWARNGLGCTLLEIGKIEKAIMYLEEALKCADEVGDKIVQGSCLRNLGVAYFRLGKDDIGCQLIKKALKLANEINDRIAIQISLNLLSSCDREKW